MVDSCSCDLLTDAKLRDESAVAICIVASKVAKQAATLTDEDHEGTSCTSVLFVGAEVLGEIFDALGEQRNLDFGGTGVLLIVTILFDDRGCGLFV